MLPMNVTEDVFERETSKVPGIVTDTLAKFETAPFGHYLDFGCDLGLKTYGYATSGKFTKVTGLDVQDNFRNLHDVLVKFGRPDMPETLDFLLSAPSTDLSAQDQFDGILSWSVFEHVHPDIIDAVLAEVYGCLRPGGHSFIQVNPLFYSQHGAHLWGLLEPWEHLESDEKVHALIDERSPTEQRAKAAKSLFGTLNRLRLADFRAAFTKAGFEIADELIGRSTVSPPPELAERFDMDDLMTEGFRIVLRKPA